MQRIPALDPATASPEMAATLDQVKAKLGTVPNALLTMARAPAVLNAYLGFSSALNGGKLPHILRTQIALAAAHANACGYCASLHSAVGRRQGLSEEEVRCNLEGRSKDGKTAAALAFVNELISTRGEVSGAGLAGLKTAGFTEDEILEIVANTALNLFTNYFNHVAGTELDFPKVMEGRAAA